MLLIPRRLLFPFALFLTIGCNLPTSPENGHSALALNDSVTSGRTRAADPLGHRLSPPCSAPAPLRSAFPQERVPGYIFKYHDGTDAQLVTSELAARYGFSPQFVFNVVPGFAAVVSEQALGEIRCDNRVEFVEYNVKVYLAK